MKNLIIFISLFTAFAFLSPTASAQIKIDLKGKIKREADRRANKKADKGVKKGFDKMEEGAKGIFKKKDTIPNADGTQTTTEASGAKGNKQAVTNKNAPALKWNKYDFVPGDKIIFEDNLLGEENGEFPSRWDFRSGNIEIAEFGGENVIMFRDRASEIIPYMKEPGKDYLPEVFTIEFDLYCGYGKFEAHLYDRKNQKSGSPSGYTSLGIYNKEMTFARAQSAHPEEKSLEKRRWIHVAIAYTNGKLKAYMDETRLINLPRIDYDPKGLSFFIYNASNEYKYYVKNVRIAEGGVKYYDRFLQDGKIVSNGIRFDVNKATLRPESMGVLNEIYKLLDEHPEVKFSIEGHTDRDGDFDFNQKLSEDRAKTVMNQLVSMGINSERFSSKGFGESKPINSNDTPEGKADNRRVEFVKSN